jgi:murein DD-endopeptidase MepM/ murein hydrolase activator NlpD
MSRISQSLEPGPKRPMVSWRRNIVLKRSLIFLLLAFALLFVCGVSGAAGLISDKLVLYIHVAGLYTKSPDNKLSMPVKDITKSQVKSTWGAPREGHRHEGQDIFAPKGTHVLSATTGYVVKIGEDNLGGHTVSVIGDGGRKYYYAHLDSYAPRLEVGDYVTRKTVLGYVGTTGNAAGTPAHLHFGVYASDGAIDPLPLLTDRPQEIKVTSKTERTQKKKR